MNYPSMLEERHSIATPHDNLQLPRNLTVYFDYENQVLYIKWEGSVNTREFRDGYVHVLRLVQLYKPTKWVLDLQKRDGIQKKDQIWVFRHIFPKVLRLVREDVFVAVILPVNLYESILHDLDGDDMIFEDKVMLLQHFLYHEEGLRWLNEMQQGSGVA
ncbi:hypothetical protein [Pontibacter burrus]|uniref:STAS/SEC14 domain-containing protein n=1 Tax=Pontibacter burrus TaxID=2704466 RepID=A0A6B3LWH7_9BACT|nr:hypothetical protein [Pontibacter burrus]NEM97837.1 hypothetical protein [Pontibacter burrus]